MPHVIIPVSQHTAEALERQLGVRDNLHTIENGIHVNDVTQISVSPLASDIIYAGRLVDLKHIDVLVRAVVIIAKEHPKVTCLIVGDGPERIKLEALAIEQGVADNILFTGFLDNHNDVLAAMKSSKVFVLPSSREGFGLVAIEANAAGIPVVTVNEEANAAYKLIDSTNGLVTSLQPQAVADAIATLLHTPISNQQCVTAARRYDWSQLTRKLEVIFQ
jgi:L-malate glycosyltransferase